jgi:protein pelota
VRLVHHDRRTDLWKLRLETPSDLWRITRFIHPGEIVGASTTRRDPEAPADVASAEKSRRRVWLVVRAEQVEFHGFTKHVRISGPIVEGPFDIGRHHTLDLAEGDEVSVVKPSVSAGDRTILDEGIEGRGDATILIAAVDWGDSALVRVRGRAILPVVDLRRTIAGKQFGGGQGEKDRAQYVAELLELIRREAAGATAVILAGPGFLKEDLAKRLSEADRALRARLKIFATSESGRVGVDELLRSGRAAEALAGTVAAEELGLVEELVRGLGSGTRAAVGREEVEEAVLFGAVGTLLVSESLLADPTAIPVLEMARKAQARLFVVREDGEAGRRLKSVGGLGAILRFDWTSSHPKEGPKRSPGPPRAGPRTGA